MDLLADAAKTTLLQRRWSHPAKKYLEWYGMVHLRQNAYDVDLAEEELILQLFRLAAERHRNDDSRIVIALYDCVNFRRIVDILQTRLSACSWYEHPKLNWSHANKLHYCNVTLEARSNTKSDPATYIFCMRNVLPPGLKPLPEGVLCCRLPLPVA